MGSKARGKKCLFILPYLRQERIRLTAGCGALPCLLTEDTLHEIIVFYHQEKIFICGGSLPSSSGFGGLRTIEQVVSMFRYAPKGGQSTKYLYYETLYLLFYSRDECTFLLFQCNHSHMLLVVHSWVLSVMIVEVILIFKK